MSSPFLALLAVTTAELDLGAAAFRLRGVDPMTLAQHQRFQLLIVGVPDPETKGALEHLDSLRDQGANPVELGKSEARVLTDLAMRRFAPELQREEQLVTQAILSAGVTHWKAADGDWRPVRIVPTGELMEGDGVKVPDEIPVCYLPGAAAGANALREAILRLSGLDEEVATRVSRFRRADRAGDAPGSDGAPVRVPSEQPAGS